MDVFSAFATDEEKEVNGVWQQIGGGAEILVARAGNKKYSRKLSALYERHQRTLDSKTEAAEQLSEQIMVETMAETILLGWRRREGDQVINSLKFKGSELTYSVENAKKLLGVKDFRQLVNRLAAEFDAYRAEQEEALGKS